MPNEPTELPPPEPVAAATAATQLSILLSAAASLIDEEFKRSERLDAKSRNQVAVTATLFAVVQAAVISLFNGRLAPDPGAATSAFAPWLAVTACIGIVSMVCAVLISYQAWKLRDDPALDVETIREYRDWAYAGHPAVGVQLISAYADIAQGRRDSNAVRARALDRAAKVCGVCLVVIAVELLLAFLFVADF